MKKNNDWFIYILVGFISALILVLLLLLNDAFESETQHDPMNNFKIINDSSKIDLENC